METLPPILGFACLVAVPMFIVFALLKRDIKRVNPEIKLTKVYSGWIFPFAVLRLHRDFYSSSTLRNVFWVLWVVALVLYLIGFAEVLPSLLQHNQ